MQIPALPYGLAQALPPLRWVDLRSPAEFARDHIPGAVSVPLFDDTQRAMIGTLYHQNSPAQAYAQGLSMAEKRMAQILQRILGREVESGLWQRCFAEVCQQLTLGSRAVELQTFQPGSAPVPSVALYCWRGGMRSRSVAALFQALGEPVLLLEGGYKNYRQWVRETLEKQTWPRLLVLRGPTGVGKTKILGQLEQKQPGSVLCLESLAQHRSSVLGAVGKEPVSQPAFESRLLARLREMGPGPWFVEGESRKVGDIILPATLFQAMEEGEQWCLQASTARRVQNLLEDYLQSPGAIDAIGQRLPFLEGRIGPRWVGQLQAWLEEGRAAEVAEVLLERYYDPLYAHSDRRRNFAANFDVEQPELLSQMLERRASLAD